jgi:hypothetical protein
MLVTDDRHHPNVLCHILSRYYLVCYDHHLELRSRILRLSGSFPDVFCRYSQPLASNLNTLLFLAQAQRHRTLPIWKHKDLRPIVEPERAEGEGYDAAAAAARDAESDEETDNDPFIDAARELGEEDEEEEGLVISRQTFAEQLTRHIQTCRSFADALEYQLAFQDLRFLANVDRFGRSFFHFAEECLTYEQRVNSSRSANPTTWGPQSQYTMFYRTRPSQTYSQCAR